MKGFSVVIILRNVDLLVLVLSNFRNSIQVRFYIALKIIFDVLVTGYLA